MGRGSGLGLFWELGGGGGVEQFNDWPRMWKGDFDGDFDLIELLEVVTLLWKVVGGIQFTSLPIMCTFGTSIPTESRRHEYWQWHAQD